MKISWPVGITALILVFMAGTMTMVYIAVHQDFSLVSKDYYEESLQYDLVKEKQENRMRDKTDIQFIYSEESQTLNLFFSEQDSSVIGILHFYKASEINDDFSVPVNAVSGNQSVDVSQLVSGKWKVKADWKQNNVDYLQEFVLMKK